MTDTISAEKITIWKKPMATIYTIRNKIKNEEYEFTIPHFFEEMANDDITFTYYHIWSRVIMQKNKENVYNYGNCEICDTPLEEQYIKQDFWIKGELIVVDRILAGVCPNCGEKIVNANAAQHIIKLFEDTELIANAPRISVPILTFEEYETIA